MDRLYFAAHGLVLYTAAQFLWVPVTAWMWWAWAATALVIAVVAGLVRFIRTSLGSEAGTPRTSGVRWWPVASATFSFIVLAVMTASLESGDHSTAGLYWPLAVGLVWVVGLYLASYDRRRPWRQAPDGGA